MIEKNKDELHPWSLASALIGASYLSQICFELDIDFEVSILTELLPLNMLKMKKLII